MYRNRNALPRAFLVDRQKVVNGGDAALRATLDPRFDARDVAVTERPVEGIAPGDDKGPGTAGTARLVSYDTERVAIRAQARRRSLLVLTDVHYPGWKAKIDGRPATVERVDYLLRGVAIPAGRHDVELRYEPASWRLGWLISALASLALVAAAVVGWRRRRLGGGRAEPRPSRRRRSSVDAQPLAAALIYAVITLVFLGPALLPGKTLSNSDVLWFEPPFVTAKPDALQTPSNPELGDAITHLQLFLHRTAREIPPVPLWDPYIAGGRPYHANSQSAVFGPLHPGPPTSCRSGRR